MPLDQNKPTILFLGTQMEVAGAQQVLLSQAGWFYEHGYPVRAVFLYDKQGLKDDWEAAYPFPVISLNGRKLAAPFPSNPIRLLSALIKLFGLLKNEIAVIVCFTPHSNLLGLPLAWLAGVPVRIGTHHGHIEGSSKWLQRMHGWLSNSRLCSMMVAVSAQVRDYATLQEGVHPTRLKVIENGIEPPRLDGLESKSSIRHRLDIPPDGIMLLTVGRLTVQKGHTILLDAAAKLSGKFPILRFVFAGDGPQRSSLESKAEAHGLENQVIFLGLRSDIPALLKAADIFVQPSLWEGLSLALLEALFAGLPVLATRVEGVVDVVEDGKSALLVPPGDSDALANGLAKLIGDESLRERLGRAGLERAREKYTLGKMCASYESLILGLLPDAS